MIEGKKAFGDAIHSEEYLSTIKAYLKDLFGLFAEWVFFFLTKSFHGIILTEMIKIVKKEETCQKYIQRKKRRP